MLLQNENLKNCDIEIPAPVSGTYDAFDIDYNFHAVVNHCSGPGINAAIAGSNVLVDKKSLAYPMSIKLKDIENPPQKRNKDKWLVEMCHTEYTVDEINKGLWLTRLKKRTGVGEYIDCACLIHDTLYDWSYVDKLYRSFATQILHLLFECMCLQKALDLSQPTIPGMT